MDTKYLVVSGQLCSPIAFTYYLYNNTFRIELNGVRDMHGKLWIRRCVNIDEVDPC